jgi:hypothetical protein
MLNLEHKIVQPILLGKLAKSHVFLDGCGTKRPRQQLVLESYQNCQHMTSADRTVGRVKALIKNKTKFSSYIRKTRRSGCKVIYD